MVRAWLGRMKQLLLVSPEALATDPRIASRRLHPEKICQVANVQRLADLGPRNTLILDATRLIDPAARAATLRTALESGIRMLFIEVSTPDEGARLETALPEIAQRLDSVTDDTPPGALYGVNPVDLLRFCLAADPDAIAALEGMSTRHVPRKTLALLPPTVQVRTVTPLRRLFGDPRVPIYLAVGIYSALRALPVALIPQFHGSLFVLWSIDIITAIPYTWGVLAMLFAPRRAIRLLAAATTIVTFVAPYVYFWMNGRDYPPYVVIVIAGLTIMSVLLEFGKYAQEKTLRRRYLSVRVAATVRMSPVTISQIPDASQTATIQGSATG